MRFLILNTDYPEFLRWLYGEHPKLDAQPYEQQLRARRDSLFGVADFYSSNLRKLGHEAWDIHLNNEPLQRAWATEHDVALPPPRRAAKLHLRRGVVPWINIAPDPQWMHDALAAQIKHFKPDVILNQDVRAAEAPFLKATDASVRFVIGQCASPLSRDVDLRGYDLMISSLPNYIESFRRDGLKAELHRLAFEPRVLQALDVTREPIAASFVGTLSRDHRTRTDLIEQLCRTTPLLVWGQGREKLSSHSPIRARHQGAAWGRHMYQVLRDSRITVNHHIGIAGDSANNMRLYEATGVGTLLVTDAKQNLREMFEPGKELVTYRSPVECAELIEYYLAHDLERATIARAGQQRTLREHNYHERMKELVALAGQYLGSC